MTDTDTFFPDQRRVAVIDDDKVVLGVLTRSLSKRGAGIRATLVNLATSYGTGVIRSFSLV